MHSFTLNMNNDALIIVIFYDKLDKALDILTILLLLTLKPTQKLIYQSNFDIF
jgi:hypothetical protein